MCLGPMLIQCFTCVLFCVGRPGIPENGKELEISVTVGGKGEDILPGEVSVLKEWFLERCPLGFIMATERGGTVHHLHV